jgi:hypothetical protein
MAIDITGGTVFLCQNGQGASSILDNVEDESDARVVVFVGDGGLVRQLLPPYFNLQDIHIQLVASCRYTTERKLG